MRSGVVRLLAALSCCIAACSAADLPPIVAQGRHVLIRHSEPQDVCAGTVAYFDDIVEEFYARFVGTRSDDAVISSTPGAAAWIAASNEAPE